MYVAHDTKPCSFVDKPVSGVAVAVHVHDAPIILLGGYED